MSGPRNTEPQANGALARALRRRNPDWNDNTVHAVPWCTTPIEAESSLGPDSHHPIISLSGIPSAVMVLRILHPILAFNSLCRQPSRSHR